MATVLDPKTGAFVDEQFLTPADAPTADTGTFGGLQDPKSRSMWDAFRQRSSAAVQGINKMPFVFGGGDQDYASLASMSPNDIMTLFYGRRSVAPAASSGGAASGLSPDALALLASFGGLGFGSPFAPSGDLRGGGSPDIQSGGLGKI